MKDRKELFVEILQDAYNKGAQVETTQKELLDELKERLKEVVYVHEKI
ncbi:MAG: hypothetical protein ACI35R_03840 [Bacillus sp. (in: firmicutes)]